MADIPASATVQSLKCVFWLYRHCEDLNNAADTKYREFGAAIRGLDQAVTRLQRIAEQPNRIHGALQNGFHRSNAQQYDPEVAARTTDILKDFKATLMDCEILLTNKAHFQTDASDSVQNVLWGTSTQTEVNMLQQRIAVETQQALLLLSTISFDENRNVAEQHHDPNLAPINLSLDPFPISQSLIFKFYEASQRDPPLGFCSPENFPLGHGFAALRAHMQQSTTKSPPGSRQTVHQYLSLLKSQWILQCMQQQPSLKALDVWDKDKIDAQYYEDIIVSQLTRYDLTKWRHEDIVRLPDNYFLIWDARPINVVQNPMNALRGEKQILFTPSGFNGFELVVFRVVKHPTGTGARVVRKPVAADPEVQWVPEALPVDSFKDKLVPLYALPKPRQEQFSLGLHKSGSAEESPYNFDNLQDVLKLQWALTCYTVVSDTENVDWAIARPSVFRSPHGEGSRVQIWMWDPDNALAQAASRTDSESDSDSRSIVSQLTAQSAITILQDSEKPHVAVSTKSQTKYSITEVIEAVMPYEPLLIVYAKHSGRYCYLCLELGSEIFIDPTTCDCSKKQGRCRRVVFKNRSGSSLTVKRVVAKTTDAEDMPDLNIFARSFRKGEAAHPHFRNEQTVEKISGGHVALDFASVALRRRFNNHFAITRKLRVSIESTDADLESHARHIADRPLGRGNPHDRVAGPSRTVAALTTSSSPSVHSDQTIRQQRRSYTLPYASSAAPQQQQQHQQRPSIITDPRHDSAVFSAPVSRVPSIITTLSELEDRNGSPTELDGNSVLRYPAPRGRAAFNQRSSIDTNPNGASAAHPQRQNNERDPDPGGTLAPPRARGAGNLQVPSEHLAYSGAVNGSSAERNWPANGRSRSFNEP